MNKEKLLGIFLILIIAAFIGAMPYLNDHIRNSASNLDIKENKIPKTYTCTRKVVDKEYNMEKVAKYYIEDKKITKVDINIVYKFNNITAFNNFKNSNKENEIIKQKYTYQESDLIIKEEKSGNIDTFQHIDANSFPKIYEGLLIYTEDQECNSEY